jgi:hypothetical protein
MKIIPIALILVSFSLFSCNNSATEPATELGETNDHSDHQHTDAAHGIALNNGEKWSVDATMLVHIRALESDINTFATANQKDYAALVEKLKSNLDVLTSNCTMTGTAHDELHKWLLPYIDLVDALSEATDDTYAALQFETLQASFATFNQYFQ